MKLLNQIILSSIQTCILVIAAGYLQAERIQTTGTPGSPGATTTISGKQLPPPDPKFGGVIKDTATDSKPWCQLATGPPTVQSISSCALLAKNGAAFDPSAW